MKDPYEAVRSAVLDAWRLGMGTAIQVLELHHRSGTPIPEVIQDLRKLSAEGPK